LFERENIFSLLNTDTIYAQSFHIRHALYLRKMRFKATEKSNIFVLHR